MEVSTYLIMILGGCCIPCLVRSTLSFQDSLSSPDSGLVKSVRSVAFSPGVKLLAAAGDSKLIALYDVSSGEQVAYLGGSTSWIFSLDWNDTGEYLLSGYAHSTFQDAC